MRKTGWKVFADRGATFRIRCEYGLHKIGEQDPYVSVTAEVQIKKRNNRWDDDSFGCQHDLVAKHFPELSPLIRWHLSTATAGPMHYVANALYWFEKAAGRSKWLPSPFDPEPVSTFKHHVVFGAVPGDVMPELTASNDQIKEWLLARLPKLLEAMAADLAALGLSEAGG